jgi:hypothetical protein
MSYVEGLEEKATGVERCRPIVVLFVSLQWERTGNVGQIGRGTMVYRKLRRSAADSNWV